jgi:hypothetical protein
MSKINLNIKTKEWLHRYIPAEVLGTVGALIGAWLVFTHTHSYIGAAASGWVGEGIGFYGYFITTELLAGSKKFKDQTVIKRIWLAISAASTNLFVEFLPAELFDNFIIRPYAMFIAPQYIHPYPVGFLVGKFSADLVFYVFAIIGYEARKRIFK